MSNYINKSVFTGHLRTDLKVYEATDTRPKQVNFSLVQDKDYVSKSGDVLRDSLWIRFVAYGKLVEEIEQQVQKGMFLKIKGQFQTNRYPKRDENGEIIKKNGSGATEYVYSYNFVVGKFIAGANAQDVEAAWDDDDDNIAD